MRGVGIAGGVDRDDLRQHVPDVLHAALRFVDRERRGDAAVRQRLSGFEQRATGVVEVDAGMLQVGGIEVEV